VNQQTHGATLHHQSLPVLITQPQQATILIKHHSLLHLWISETYHNKLSYTENIIEKRATKLKRK
jgi:hypothetical protein